MSSSLHHSNPLLIISLLLFTFSGESLSAAVTFRSDLAVYGGRRNTQTAEFLHAHNIARVSSGALKLKWDKGLAQYASKWANQRKLDCKLAHSGGPYGENIFWYRKSENWSANRVVAKWMEESLNYNPMTNTCQYGKMCGHYTQIIWRATSAVGCARARCYNNLGFLVVCVYSPSGNYEGESPFDFPK